MEKIEINGSEKSFQRPLTPRTKLIMTRLKPLEWIDDIETPHYKCRINLIPASYLKTDERSPISGSTEARVANEKINTK